jgi:hypothetical protein
MMGVPRADRQVGKLDGAADHDLLAGFQLLQAGLFVLFVELAADVGVPLNRSLGPARLTTMMKRAEDSLSRPGVPARDPWLLLP